MGGLALAAHVSPLSAPTRSCAEGLRILTAPRMAASATAAVPWMSSLYVRYLWWWRRVRAGAFARAAWDARGRPVLAAWCPLGAIDVEEREGVIRVEVLELEEAVAAEEGGRRLEELADERGAAVVGRVDLRSLPHWMGRRT